jgi:hypothetical protein
MATSNVSKLSFSQLTRQREYDRFTKKTPAFLLQEKPDFRRMANRRPVLSGCSRQNLMK